MRCCADLGRCCAPVTLLPLLMPASDSGTLAAGGAGAAAAAAAVVAAGATS